MTGSHYRDYHLLLDEQGDQIFAMTDALAERVRKLGFPTIHSIGQIASLQTVKDDNREAVTPLDMLTELMNDNARFNKANATPTPRLR
jgi:starvation-inducible DNA-binding protein